MIAVQIRPRVIIRALAVVAAALLGLSLASQYAAYYLGHGSLLGATRRFNADLDTSVYGWFSSTVCFLLALVLSMVAAGARQLQHRSWRHWAGLALVFVALSMEEAVDFHSMSAVPLGRLGGSVQLVVAVAALAGAAALLWVLVAHLRFWRSVPPPAGRRFAVAAVLVLLGALVLDELSGPPGSSFQREVLVVLEEGTEMTGLLLFLRAAFGHLEAQLPGVHVGLHAAEHYGAPVLADGPLLRPATAPAGPIEASAAVDRARGLETAARANPN